MTIGRGGVRFTTYRPDDIPHPVNNLWTECQVVWFSNFKKWDPDSLIRCPTRNFKIT